MSMGYTDFAAEDRAFQDRIQKMRDAGASEETIRRMIAQEERHKGIRAKIAEAQAAEAARVEALRSRVPSMAQQAEATRDNLAKRNQAAQLGRYGVGQPLSPDTAALLPPSNPVQAANTNYTWAGYNPNAGGLGGVNAEIAAKNRDERIRKLREARDSVNMRASRLQGRGSNKYYSPDENLVQEELDRLRQASGKPVSPEAETAIRDAVRERDPNWIAFQAAHNKWLDTMQSGRVPEEEPVWVSTQRSRRHGAVSESAKEKIRAAKERRFADREARMTKVRDVASLKRHGATLGAWKAEQDRQTAMRAALKRVQSGEATVFDMALLGMDPRVHPDNVRMQAAAHAAAGIGANLGEGQSFPRELLDVFSQGEPSQGAGPDMFQQGLDARRQAAIQAGDQESQQRAERIKTSRGIQLLLNVLVPDADRESMAQAVANGGNDIVFDMMRQQVLHGNMKPEEALEAYQSMTGRSRHPKGALYFDPYKEEQIMQAHKKFRPTPMILAPGLGFM